MPLLSTSAKPRAIPSIPSVTMNGGIAALVTRKPFSAPVSDPVARQPRTPIHQGSSTLEASIAPTTPESASIDPTERSMPADEMTNVMPIANVPNTDVESRMLRMLETERNAFDSIAITMQRTASTMRDSSRTAAPLAKRARHEGGAAPVDAEVIRPSSNQVGTPDQACQRSQLDSLDVLQHRILVRLDDLLCQNEGRDIDCLLNFVAGEELFYVIDRLHADKIGQLRDRGVEPAGLDRFDGVGIAVDANNDELVLARLARRLDRTQRHVVIGAEDGHQIGGSLQGVVGDVGGLQAVPVAWQRSDDVEARGLFLQLFGEAVRALLACDVAGKAFDYQNRPLGALAEHADQIVRAFATGRLVVRADMEGDVGASLFGDGGIEIVVQVDDWNLHLVRLLEAGQEDGRIDRRGDHGRGLLLQHGVAGVQLRLGGLVGFDRVQEDLDAGVLPAFVNALLHRAPERVGERLHQDAVDRLIGGESGRSRKAQRKRRD